MPKINKPPTEAELYSRLSRQCSLSEYAPSDIRQKVIRAGLGSSVAERIIDRLSDEGYINEERYIRAFVHDKFELNHWGRRKIEAALYQKGLRGAKVQDVLADIDEERYVSILSDILHAKDKTISPTNQQERFQKLLSFAAARGFEPQVAYSVLSSMISNGE